MTPTLQNIIISVLVVALWSWIIFTYHGVNEVSVTIVLLLLSNVLLWLRVVRLNRELNHQSDS